MEILRIVLKNGEVKKFPWERIEFIYTDSGRVQVWEHGAQFNKKRGFLFSASIENINYVERVNET